MAKKATKIEKAMSKSAILIELADRTELSRKQVGRVLDELAALIEPRGGASDRSGRSHCPVC